MRPHTWHFNSSLSIEIVQVRRIAVYCRIWYIKSSWDSILGHYTEIVSLGIESNNIGIWTDPSQDVRSSGPRATAWPTARQSLGALRTMEEPTTALTAAGRSGSTSPSTAPTGPARSLAPWAPCCSCRPFSGPRLAHRLPARTGARSRDTAGAPPPAGESTLADHARPRRRGRGKHRCHRTRGRGVRQTAATDRPSQRDRGRARPGGSAI
jgi:hypothetical protein